jgi:hypothetical protein
LGVVLKRHPRSLEGALRKSGLGWTVRQEPLYRRDNKPVDGWQADGLPGAPTQPTGA